MICLLETKIDAGNNISRVAKLGNIGKACTCYERFWKLVAVLLKLIIYKILTSCLALRLLSRFGGGVNQTAWRTTTFLLKDREIPAMGKC